MNSKVPGNGLILLLLSPLAACATAVIVVSLRIVSEVGNAPKNT